MTTKPRAPRRHSVIPPQAKLRLRPQLQRVLEKLRPPKPRVARPPGKAAEDSAPITVTLALRRQRDLPALKSLADLSPARRKYLGAEELKDFGASQEDLEAVEAYVAQKGLDIERVFPAAAMVVVRGTPKAVAEAFMPPGAAGDFVEASIPSELAGRVRWIFGLDARELSRPSAFLRSRREPLPKSIARNAYLKELLVPRGHVAPDVARFYGYPELRGEGQCVGLLQLGGGASEEDLKMYFKALKLELPEIVYVGENIRGRGRFNVEVTFDIALVGAVCPRARIAVYNSHDVSVNGILVALCMALFDEVNKPSVLSMSWSFPEIAGQGPTKLETEIFDELFALAAWRGISVCMSSGDSGALTPIGYPDGRPTAVPAANFPASSPYVLACGGTTLLVKDGAIHSEVVWNSLTRPMLFLNTPGGDSAFPYPMATGGGISCFYERPVYQKHAHVPPRVDCYWFIGHLERVETFHGRGTPDVSASADWMTGYEFIFQGKWNTMGGTSAAAPMWAALLTLMNEGLEANHGPGARVGWINPYLYRLCLEEGTDVCRPIHQGNNGGFQAHPERRWNPCTGLGSPDGKKLSAALGAWPVKSAPVRAVAGVAAWRRGRRK
ncbi:S8/S53 family peptidase [Archangium violaceum]|uniref:S53 family peptidase n=1 Tax=Archangium violaceum TaxID=83451 RepID=UPI0019529D39|nr:S53 family peptidase [Archangium violaceum]QRO00160.1 S8/S53 family peptidase [Archangium violaceum]